MTDRVTASEEETTHPSAHALSVVEYIEFVDKLKHKQKRMGKKYN